MRIIKDKEIYEEVVQKGMLRATKLLWIATANIKDMQVKDRRKYHSILDSFAVLARNGLQIRLIHASTPSARFRESLSRIPDLVNNMEMLVCPRVHFKTVIVDGEWAYTGSANFTGAGMGVKSSNRRNFEIGIIVDEPAYVSELMNYYDQIWIGQHCPRCGLRDVCPQPII